MRKIESHCFSIKLRCIIWLSMTAFLMLSPHKLVARTNPQVTPPETVGFSNQRLKQLDTIMQRAIDEREYAGIVTLVARHGKIVHIGVFGKNDLESATPLEPNVIFRIFSMTKPVTAVAMMILYEEGRWNPQDPISKFIPQFARLKVFSGIGPSGEMLLEDPIHAPTMRELMTHTAGFSSGGNGTPVDRAYQDENNRSIFQSGSLQAMIDRLSKAPLLYQPSSRWVYSVSTDIQGYIIEKISGMSLPEFMRRRIFEPLQMRDTDFYVPEDKRNRLAALYKMNERRELVAVPSSELTTWGLDYDHEPTLPKAGAGLVSSAADYLRFAQMLLNDGELDGVRVLGPNTVRLMTSNHLSANLMTEFRGGGYSFSQPRPGVGYGFNGAVVTNSGQADVPLGQGSYFWDGAAGTWFWIDPENDIAFVGMVQRLNWGIYDNVMGAPPNLEELSRAATYQALIRPEL